VPLSSQVSPNLLSDAGHAENKTHPQEVRVEERCGLEGTQKQLDNNQVASVMRPEPLLRLADNLKELEVVVGDRARGVVAEVRQGLMEAIAARERGDLPNAIALIRAAMEKLAALGGSLDPAEGTMMREVAARFVRALNSGDENVTDETVKIMRRKAGDPKDDDTDR
jgi:hypothetical protein